MTPNEFYERLQLVTESTTATLSPGPLEIKVGQSDAMAARLILWLQDEMPEDATIYDLFDVLAAATWWATFWSSLESETDHRQECSERNALKLSKLGTTVVITAVVVLLIIVIIYMANTGLPL